MGFAFPHFSYWKISFWWKELTSLYFNYFHGLFIIHFLLDKILYMISSLFNIYVLYLASFKPPLPFCVCCQTNIYFSRLNKPVSFCSYSGAPQSLISLTCLSVFQQLSWGWILSGSSGCSFNCVCSRWWYLIS